MRGDGKRRSEKKQRRGRLEYMILASLSLRLPMRACVHAYQRFCDCCATGAHPRPAPIGGFLRGLGERAIRGSVGYDRGIMSKIADRATADDFAYQERILPRVSRTFALTIPALPKELCLAVSNAYLLCRIADTIEDEPALSAVQKGDYGEQFALVTAGAAPAAQLVEALSSRWSQSTLESEQELVAQTARVVRITHSLPPAQRAALARCVRIMCRGMSEFQLKKTLLGLDDVPHLDRYCYHVAGVVGEMLTELFCLHSEEIGHNRDELMRLAVSFGQGLQMTNILKDIWEDRARGACWLPRDVFERHGVSLDELRPGAGQAAFQNAMSELIGIARTHLANALEYTLLIPSRERAIRRFCLWALGMAVLTLRKLHRHLDFASGTDVKITRNSVKMTVAVTSVAAGSDVALRMLFNASTRRLPDGPDQSTVLSL